MGINEKFVALGKQLHAFDRRPSTDTNDEHDDDDDNNSKPDKDDDDGDDECYPHDDEKTPTKPVTVATRIIDV